MSFFDCQRFRGLFLSTFHCMLLRRDCLFRFTFYYLFCHLLRCVWGDDGRGVCAIMWFVFDKLRWILHHLGRDKNSTGHLHVRGLLLQHHGCLCGWRQRNWEGIHAITLAFGIRIAGTCARMAVRNVFTQRIFATRHVIAHLTRVSKKIFCNNKIYVKLKTLLTSYSDAFPDAPSNCTDSKVFCCK